MIFLAHRDKYYSLQYNCFQDFFGIYPFGRGIYPKIAGRYLDIRLCSIPTVGVYETKGKLHLTRSTSYLLFIIHLRRFAEARSLPPPPRWTPLQLAILLQPAAQLGEGL